MMERVKGEGSVKKSVVDCDDDDENSFCNNGTSFCDDDDVCLV